MAKDKRLRVGAACLVVLLVASIIAAWPANKANAAVTVGSSTANTATEFSQERHTWYDGSRYWVGYYDNANTRIDFFYSTDGTTWSEDTNARIAITLTLFQGFSIYGDSTNVFVVYSYTSSGGSSSTKATQAGSTQGYASASPTTWTWASSTLVSNISNCTSIGGSDSWPVITRDTNNMLLVGVYCGANTSTWEYSISTSANSTAGWSTQSAITTSANANLYGDITPLAAGNAYSAYFDGTAIKGKKDSAGTWDTNATPLATGTSGLSTNLSMVSNTTANEAYMSYIDSGGKTIFRKYTDSNGAASSKINDAANPGVMDGFGRSVARTSNGNLYSFINSGGTCGIWKSTNEGSTWTEQDSAHHPSCLSTGGVALAVDSTDKLHLAYSDATNNFATYILYNTSTDTFGTPETAQSVEGGGYSEFAIAVDSNDKPHLAAYYSFSGNGSGIDYNNRVSGSWSTALALFGLTGGSVIFPALTIDKDNTPEISYICTQVSCVTGTYAAKGTGANPNNPTAFSQQNLDTTPNTTAATLGSSIAVDAAGNTWVAYVDATGTNQINLIKHNYGDAWTTWQTAVTDTKVGKEPSIATSGNMIYLLYQNGSNAIVDDIYNVDTASFSGETTLQSGTLRDVHVRWAYNSNNTNKPLDYLYSDGTDIYYNQLGLWQPPITLDSNSGNAYTSISINPTNSNDLYIFWERSNVIYYKKCVSPYASANCDAAATTKYTGGTTEAWVSAATQVITGQLKIPLIWTEGSGSPWNVEFDSINLNSPPGAPTLSSPSTGSTVTSTTPSLQMSATDPDSDTLKYNILIYNGTTQSGGNCSGSALESQDQNTAQGGWSQSGPYASGATASYTVQTPMTRGNNYCWQAQAKDPTGSNTFGSLSTPSTFTINSVPATPTLDVPSSGATQISTLPRFRLRSTDADSDYLTYFIQIYNATACGGSQVGSDIDESSNHTNWMREDANSNQAYIGASSIAGSSMGDYQYAGTPLTPNHVYSWRAKVKDPGGSNIYSSLTSCQDFTTATNEVQIQGGTDIRGGTTIQ